ncbi:hypothetical protein CC79DRAFT_655413 [Sarocladium strictum]
MQHPEFLLNDGLRRAQRPCNSASQDPRGHLPIHNSQTARLARVIEGSFALIFGFQTFFSSEKSAHLPPPMTELALSHTPCFVPLGQRVQLCCCCCKVREGKTGKVDFRPCTRRQWTRSEVVRDLGVTMQWCGVDPKRRLGQPSLCTVCSLT